VGEPLNAEAVIWGEENFDSIMDNWWQTERRYYDSQLSFNESKTGSMGKPLPGVEIAIAEVNGKQLKIITKPNVQGQLVLKGFPSYFAYLHEEERYKKCFIGEWYLSGDLAKKNDDGYFGLSVAR
jgi:acetyl-CoA synthetase